MKIKIAIAEDNDLLAGSIIEKIGFFDDLKFKYRAINGAELIKMVKKDPVVDVIFMDIQMPEMDGIAATETLNKLFPQIKIIMLTVFDDEEKIFRAILAGASGYLLKDETPSKIYAGVKEIMDGGAPMSANIAQKALKLLRNPITQNSPTRDFNLSDRELEILDQLSRGISYQQIADNLFISSGTVRKHVENTYRKLHAHNKVEALSIARENRLI